MGVDAEFPDVPVFLEIFDNENLVSRVNANRFRHDLQAAGIGNGEHGFSILIPKNLKDGNDHSLSVKYENSDQHLSGSPVIVRFPCVCLNEGYIGIHNEDYIEGWAWDRKKPDFPVCVEIFDNENLVSKVTADRFRIDLYCAKLGNGEHGFSFLIPKNLKDGNDHSLSVKYENSDQHLSGSPFIIHISARKPVAFGENTSNLNEPLFFGYPVSESELKKLTTKKIQNLGELLDPRYAGIYTIIPDQEVVDLYLHDEFRSGASEYDKRSTNPAYYIRLMTDLIGRLESDPFNRNPGFYQGDVKILDIGSGSGHSIFPILHFFSGARIIASDLSPDMLLLLKNNLPDEIKCNNLSLLQLNAEDLAFKENSFDIVFGFSILHHLFSPEITLQQCSNVLKNGGLAVFFEPFESGHGLLRNVFEKILSDPQSKSLSPLMLNLFNAHILFFDIQTGTDKSLSCFKHIEDKWVFTAEYFKGLAARYGFCEPVIYNINPSEIPLENKIRGIVVALNAGATAEDTLPAWAWEIIRGYDRDLPEKEKQTLLFEGCIILQKRTPES
jgi:ubiquinone/menaquinone biosynthesis C-methylase UbiE